MFFLDDEHLDGFLRLVSRYHKERQREYVSTYYLFTSNKELRFKTLYYISTDNGSIDWSSLSKCPFSPKSKYLIDLSLELFKDITPTNLSEKIYKKDAECELITLQAIEIKQKWPQCTVIGHKEKINAL